MDLLCEPLRIASLPKETAIIFSHFVVMPLPSAPVFA